MTTSINALAAELGFDNAYGLRVWSDDLLDGIDDDRAEVPAEVEATIRDAYAASQSHDVTGPRVLSVRTETMAGRMAITATVEYGCGETLTERFQGASTPGYPGPVLYAFGDTWVRVADPQRFGDTFGADWVRAFYAWGGEPPVT